MGQDIYGFDFTGWEPEPASYNWDMPVSSYYAEDIGSSFIGPPEPTFYSPDRDTQEAFLATAGAIPEAAYWAGDRSSMPSQLADYLAESRNTSEPSFPDTLVGYADKFEEGAKKYSTLGALGMGGLQMWAAMKEREKMEARRRQQEDEQRAAIAQMQARQARMNAPINNQTAAYSQARAPLSGFKDMRQAGASRWFAPSTGNMAAAFQQEAGRMAEGGLIEGDCEDVTEYASGGLGALRGPTGGQDDKIPAMLSDGEYIFDAESVSALGDGNTAAGAKKLDEMRVKIRKHKRKGPLSSIPKKAKAPMKYLEGGKV